MIYQRGFLARPLDALFANGSQLAVLRALYKHENPVSGRALARSAGVSHQAAAKSLRVLEKLRLARRSDSGRNTRWRLEGRSFLVRELLEQIMEVEESYAPTVVQVVQGGLRQHAAGAILYGKTAKGRLQPGAPFQFAAVYGKKGRAPLAAAVRQVEATLREAWGLNAEGRVVSDEEAQRLSLFETAWRVLPDEGPDWVTGVHAAR